MLTGKELYVIAKLVTGEQIMACLNDEDEHYVEFEYPILIRLLPTPIPNRESIAASPYCQFSSDTKFLISKRNIMFIKKLHPSFVPHFMRFAKEYDMETFIPRDQPKQSLSDLFEDGDELTVEEIQKRIRMLEEIAGAEETTEEEEKNFIDGNDTIH